MAQFVDWDLAAATAGALGKSGPRVSYAEATDVVGDLRRLTDEAAGHVADVHRAAARRSRTRRCGWSTAGTGRPPTSPGCAR